MRSSFGGIQSLDDFLVGVARRVEVLDGDVARRVDEFQVEQGQQLVVLQAGFLEKIFDVPTVFSQPALPVSPQNRLLTGDGGVGTRMRRFSSKAAAGSTLMPKYSAAISPSVGLFGAAGLARCASSPSAAGWFFETPP